MPIDRIPSAGIDSGGVAPSNLSTGAPSWTTSGNLILQGGNTSANGIGVTFPATFSGSSNANTLDDYEEGSFTPIMFGSSVAGTITYNTSQTWGRYVKIGPLVNFQLAVVATAGSGASGDALIGGLPFTVRNFTNYYPSATVGFFGFATPGWTQYSQSSLLLPNTTIAAIYYVGSTGGLVTSSSVWNGASNFYLSGAYLTDS
jgi:hypothetical protein